jgi:hypothetical protein
MSSDLGDQCRVVILRPSRPIAADPLPADALMADWLDSLYRSLFSHMPARRRRWLHRKFRLSGEVMSWLDARNRTLEERTAFAELLLRLDADPVSGTTPVLRPGAPPGMRWIPFGAHKAIFVLDPSSNQIHIVTCV